MAWPICIAFAGLSVWFSSRVETPEEHARQLDMTVRPITSRLDDVDKDIREISVQLQQHRALPAHAVMLDRYDRIMSQLEKVNAQLEQISDDVTPSDATE